jgi:hypothetical protein
VVPTSLEAAPARVIPEAPSGPRCDRSQVRGKHASYEGGSVSALYDEVFRPSITMPYLDTYVPQALTVWDNWDGAGHNLVLLGMYRDGHQSYLVGLDPYSGRAIGTVKIDATHLGGMGILGGWLFAQDNASAATAPTVRRYRTDALQAAMRIAARTGEKVYLGRDGHAQSIDAIDFFAVDGDSVYAGNHGNPGPGRMFRYQLNAAGRLHRVEGPWVIPPRAQGLVVNPDNFIFSSDDGVDRGRLIVVRRGASGERMDPIACVWMPAMPEDLALYQGYLLAVFESGTTRYAHDNPVNRITHLHIGPFGSLLELLEPVVSATAR